MNSLRIFCEHSANMNQEYKLDMQRISCNDFENMPQTWIQNCLLSMQRISCEHSANMPQTWIQNCKLSMQQISCEHSANKPQTFSLKKEKNIGFYGPFKNIALISSRSYIRGGRTPILHQRWTNTGVPGEKTPDLPVQNLASRICPRHFN